MVWPSTPQGNQTPAPMSLPGRNNKQTEKSANLIGGRISEGTSNTCLTSLLPSGEPGEREVSEDIEDGLFVVVVMLHCGGAQGRSGEHSL
jgi:hypothetical protein